MDAWKEVARLSPEEIKRLQSKKLSSFIQDHLYPFSPHYRRLFDRHKIKPRLIKKISDLKYIPFTTKEDFFPTETNPNPFLEFILQPNEELIKRYWGLRKKSKLAFKALFFGKDKVKEDLEKEYKPIFITATTGTTRSPVSYVYTSYDLKNLQMAGARLSETFEMKGQDRAVNLFPYAPHLAFWQVVFAGFASNMLILSTGGGKVMGTEGNIASILKMQPEMLVGVPSYVYHLVRRAKDQGADFHFVKKIVLGASRIPQGFKEKLAALLGEMKASEICVFGTYGFTEARMAWAECPTLLDKSSGYHLYPDKEIFEVINPKSGKVKGEGEDGELVYSSIDSRGSSVLRYRTGDYVKGGITFEPCPYCRRQVPRISSDIGRLSDLQEFRLTKIKGSLVNLNVVAEILDSEPRLEEWQLEIRKKDNDPYELDELILYIAPRKGATGAKLRKELANKLLTNTEVAPNEIIEMPLRKLWKRLGVETRPKAQRIIDARPQE